MYRSILMGLGLLALAGRVQAQATDSLTLNEALERALARTRPERIAAGARVGLPANPLRPELEFAFSVGVAGSGFGGTDEKKLGFEVSRQFDPWGRSRPLRQASGFERAALLHDAETVPRDLAIEVRAAFHRVGWAERRLRLLEALTQADRTLAASTQARVRDGDLTALAGRLSGLDLLDSETRVEQARSDASQARRALAAAMAVPDEALARRPIAATDQLDTLAIVMTTLEAHVLARAEFLAQAQRVEAARQHRQAALRAARPQLSLGLGLDVTSRRDGREVFLGDPGGLEGIETRDRGVTLHLSAPWPSRENARVEQVVATAEVTAMEALSSAQQQRALSQARASADRFASEARVARLHRAQMGSITSDLARVGEAYRDGRIPLETWLAYQQRLRTSLDAAFETESRYWIARAALETAAGTSFDQLQTEVGR